MLFARYSHIVFPHLSWTVHCGLPALTTFVLPIFWLGMSRREVLVYIPAAFFMAPAIHILFSFFIGWHDYMPFPFHVPSLAEFVQRIAH